MTRTVIPFSLILILTILNLSAIGQCTRQQVVDDYNNIYLPSAVTTTELAWSGDTATCTAGTISDSAYVRTLRRINYYRELVGLPGNIVWDTALHNPAQEAALMFRANSSLSHNPPMTWKCWTNAGDQGAGASNISLGSHSANAITSFMRDNGTGNFAVGHRRWILYDRAQNFGLGSTNNSSALYVFGTSTSPAGVTYTAYPSPGFFPAPLIFPRWSFSKGGADFGNATVSMIDGDSNTVNLTLETVQNGYGNNTIVWVPQTSQIPLQSAHDEKFTVTVSNVVVNNVPQSYTYDVFIIQPSHPPACELATYVWNEDSCACIDTTPIVSILELPVSEAKFYPNPANDRLTIDFGGTLTTDQLVRISDLQGRLVKTVNLSRGLREYNLDVGELKEGMYILNLSSGPSSLIDIRRN